MTDIQERTKKLPQWAQRYIAKLHGDIESLEGELGEVASSNAKVTWRAHLYLPSGDRKYGLPDRAIVEFATDTGHIEVRLRESVVEVCASGTLSIEPEASNVVKVSCRDRWYQAGSAGEREREEKC